ncbi:MAG: glycosyltransferase [Pseudomonadota bacterium]
MTSKIPYSVQDSARFAFEFDNQIARLDATDSYLIGVTRPQKAVLKAVLASAGLFGLFQPILLCSGLAAALFGTFSLLIVWRGVLLVNGALRRLLWVEPGSAPRTAPSPASSPATGPETERPLYSILIAAYQEAPLMPQLAAALSRLDWPPDRLDVLILLEAHDRATKRAAAQLPFPPGTRILTVPPGGPLTKPNALNYGLSQALGEFVVIYDVEDLPAPDQLQRAHNLFVKAPDELVCLQARLQADNPKASWLAAQWALDYDLQFGLLLPGAALHKLPLLLGGTSNHFRRRALADLGGWDAYNVTEDADLGMRIARAGLRTQTFTSVTLEDAPVAWRIWLPQRGRWIKGYIQTWLVLMRAPGRTLKEMGGLNFLVMQLSLGGAILTPLSHAFLALLVLTAALSRDLAIGQAGLILLLAGYIVSLLVDLAAPGAWSWHRGVAVLTKPLYWPLLSLAAGLAIWDLAKRPHFWAKTPHTPRYTGRDAEPDPNCSTGSSASS